MTRSTVTEHLLETLPLTQEEKQERIKSGSLKIRNRAGWAMSHLKKAGLVQSVAKATYRATDAGKKFLAEREGQEISNKDLKEVDGYIEAWKNASKLKKETKETSADPPSDSTPEELIEGAIEQIEDNLRNEILSQLFNVDPYWFEQVVIDVLFAMGYGGSREEAAQVTQKSNDGGIDGIINEDRLGLDVIYVQAKRYQAENTIGRKEIQSFVGALAGKQANKGVFITTSDFKGTATEYAQGVPQKVILINGDRLAKLMVEHDVGVSTTRTVSIKQIDSDYFEEG